MKKKVLSIVGVVMVVGLLAGCGGNTASTGAASSAAKSSAAVSSSSAAASSSEASSSAATSSQASSAAVSSSSVAGASQASGAAGEKLKVWGPEMLDPDESVKVCDVKAVYERDVTGGSKDYITYEPTDKNEYTTYIIFTAKKEVKDFKIVDLKTEIVYDDGSVEFTVSERLNVGSLTSAKSLKAGYNFGEVIPTGGFMYTDTSGKVRLFAVKESGMDGSLLIWEIKSK